MGHRSNPSNLAKRDGEGRFAPQDSRGDYRQDMPPSYQTRRGYDESRFGRDEEPRGDPYMAANNTYREPRDNLDYGADDYPGYRGNYSNYGRSEAGRDDYDRAQHADWRREESHRRMQQSRAPYNRDDSYYAGDHRYPPTGAPHEHFDPDYHQWRSEQMSLLDKDYRAWRDDRYKKFSEDFNTWRSNRKSTETAEPAQAAESLTKHK